MKRPAYKFEPVDFGDISSYKISKRKSLVNTDMFTDLDLYKKSGAIADLFPSALKANDLKSVVTAIGEAKAKGKPVVIGMGAHLIKCGLSPIIIDLMERGFIDAIAMNGACAVHDMEIAFHGETSEDVGTEIKEGRFGMVEETALHINAALKRFVEEDTGMGEALGRYIRDEKMKNSHLSLICRGADLSIPVTLHVAIGTDIVHLHPSFDGATTGRASLNDFKLFTGVISNLGGGGVYLNIGSAVLLPEIFIKALSAARNLGSDVSDFTTVNMDMLQHYRPNVNVVNRPTKGDGKRLQPYRTSRDNDSHCSITFSLIRQSKVER